MVIDVDEVVLLQASQARTLHAIALQDDDRLGWGRVLGGLQHRIAEGQRAVDARNAIAEDDVRLLAHAAQNLAAGQRRPDGIAIWPGVRRENEFLPSADLIQNFVKHPNGPDLEPNASFSECAATALRSCPRIGPSGRVRRSTPGLADRKSVV